MEPGRSGNGNFLFFEEYEDGLKSFQDGRYHFTNTPSQFGMYGQNSAEDEALEGSSKNLFNMKLRSTVADSKFIEQSSNNAKPKVNGRSDGSGRPKNRHVFDFTAGNSNHPVNADREQKAHDRNYTKAPFDDRMDYFAHNDSIDSNIYRGSNSFDVDDFLSQTKAKCNIFNQKQPQTSHEAKSDPGSLVSALRDIADKIEYNEHESSSRHLKYEDHINYLNGKIADLNEELSSCYKELDSTRSKMEAKISELESHVRQLMSMAKEGVNGASSSSLGGCGGGSADDASTTLPAITVDFADLDDRSKMFANKLVRYLYADINDSETSLFLPKLYKCMREMPTVVDCKEVVKYVLDCIRRDSQITQSKLSQNLMFQEDEIYTDSPFGVPQSNAERQAISELESTLQFVSNAQFSRSVNGQSPRGSGIHNCGGDRTTSSKTSEDLAYVKTHVIMNRSVLAAIFKITNMNNLYNYLFEALSCDNFRVVEMINYAVCSKFMDFQMNTSFADKVRHPLIWSFGTSANSNQAYRYIKMLNYNLLRLPTDPTTGDNLWHLVARGNGVSLAQKLKSYSIYTPDLNSVNKDGKTPLAISGSVIKREFYVNLIIDLASKGSEMYKKANYDKALNYYSEAIGLQAQLISNHRDGGDNSGPNGDRGNRDSSHKDSLGADLKGRDAAGIRDHYDVNMGKLYYNKARTLMHLNRWTEAIEYCELCLKHIPNYYNAYDTCLQAYERLLDWDNAAKTCLAMRDNCGLMDEGKYRFILDQRDATFFQLLGLERGASSADIKKAFNAMCKIWHPDKVAQNMSEDVKRRCINHFNRLFEAREKLMDPAIKSLQQLKKETNYKIPTPYVAHDRPQEEQPESRVESSIEFEAKDSIEFMKFLQPKESTGTAEKRPHKQPDPSMGRSRDNLNELTMERLKFMDSINLLKGQAAFDYDSFSWGQL